MYAGRVEFGLIVLVCNGVDDIELKRLRVEEARRTNDYSLIMTRDTG